MCYDVARTLRAMTMRRCGDPTGLPMFCSVVLHAFDARLPIEESVVDLTSDGLMIGTGSAVSSSLALALAAGQVLADVPEGYATVANFRDKDVPRGKRILFSASFFIYVVGAALLSYFLLRGAPEALKMAALVFVAGLLTVAAVEDMLEEAHGAREDSRRSVLAFIGGFALFTLVSAGLETMVSGGKGAG